MAMEIEHREHRFFVALARKAKSELLRDVFSGMAQDTISLLRILRMRLRDYSTEGFWDDEEEILPYLQRLPDDLFNAAVAVKERVERLSTDREALTLAIEVEEALAGYFKDTSVRSSHPQGREAFEWLSGEKKRHAEVLKKRQNALEIEVTSG
jgi:rubrerythrin